VGAPEIPETKALALPKTAPIARSLAEALPGSMVFVDGRGQVVSPGRARLQAALGYSTRAVIGALLVGYCGALFGWAGAAAGSVYLGYGLWNLHEWSRTMRAWRILVSDPAQAQTILTRLTRGRWRPGWVRAGAHAGLAEIAVRRGDAASALAHYRAALAVYRKTMGGGRVHARAARHGEVIALCNLGRVNEARAAFAALGPLPGGDYLRLSWWMCELYVCLVEGGHAIDPNDLHERSRAALGLSSGGALVALCAWAHAVIGHDDQAEHLLAEARERSDEAELARRFPHLHTWMLAGRSTSEP